MRRYAPAAVAALCAGCTGLLTSHAAPEQTYYLRPPGTVAGSAPLGTSLRVHQLDIGARFHLLGAIHT